MSWYTKKPRSDLSRSLREIRKRIVSDGDRFWRVIGPGFDSRDFDSQSEADHYAAGLASLSVGSSLFVSERAKLDGVQVQISCREWCFSFMEEGLIA